MNNHTHKILSHRFSGPPRAGRDARRLRGTLLGILLCGALAPQPAQARNSATVTAAHNYAVTHGFTPKVVEAGPANRRVKRVFVPVTPESWNSFFKAFNEETGHYAIRHTKDHVGHNAINLKVGADGAPQDCWIWGLNYNNAGQTAQGHSLGDWRNMYMNSSKPGLIAVARMRGAPLAQLKQTLAQSHATGQRINPPGKNNCMFWMPSAKVGPGKNDHLFGHLGIKRSLDGYQMVAKMLHSANKRMEVIGVTVPQKEQFDQLTPEQLLGAEPKCGVEGACTF